MLCEIYIHTYMIFKSHVKYYIPPHHPIYIPFRNLHCLLINKAII